jgi:hypothetical protein
MLYRAIGLVLDFIHRLVCGRQKIPQRFEEWVCLRPQVDGAGQTYSVGPVSPVTETSPTALYYTVHIIVLIQSRMSEISGHVARMGDI